MRAEKAAASIEKILSNVLNSCITVTCAQAEPEHLITQRHLFNFIKARHSHVLILYLKIKSADII